MLTVDIDTCSSAASSITNSITENLQETLYIYSIPMALLQVISQNTFPIKTSAKLKKKNVFNSKAMPKISLSDYLNRIWKYSKIEEATLISALIYIDRFCAKTKLALTELNVHRLFFVSLLVAVKYNEDKFFSNIFYSKIAGMTIKELNTLERTFLVSICFDLFIDDDEFHQYQQTLDLNTIKLNKKA